MTARELENKVLYLGQERAMRQLLMDEGLATVEEVAVMTAVEVYDKVLQNYEYVGSEEEDLLFVKKEDMDTYNSLVKRMGR